MSDMTQQPTSRTTATSALAGTAASPATGRVSRLRNDRGASEAFMLIWATAMVVFAGLAFDAGMMFNARREATNIAAAAARAGADQVSTDALYGEGRVRLDPDAASVAYNSAMTAGVKTADVRRVSDVELVVEVTAEYQPAILQIIGFGPVIVGGEANAFVDRRVE